MRKLKLLFIVDDEDLVIMLTRFYTDRIQLADVTETFTNGADAFTRFRELMKNKQEPPDLILLDLYMPYMDGLSFLDSISPFMSTSKIVVISSSLDRLDRERALRFTNVIAFLEKPFEPHKLNKVLQLLE